jgi:hypothetical protein
MKIPSAGVELFCLEGPTEYRTEVTKLVVVFLQIFDGASATEFMIT